MPVPYDSRSLVHNLFIEILGRTPEETAVVHYQELLESGSLDPNSLIQVISESEECCQRKMGWQVEKSPEFVEISDATFYETSAALQDQTRISMSNYEYAWRTVFDVDEDELIIGQGSYGLHHKNRFFELLNAIALLNENPSECYSVLEFGPSEFTRLYKSFFPNLSLTTADRPVPPDYIGFNRHVSIDRLGAERYLEIDLTRTNAYEVASSLSGTQDLVLFCEVLEHLDVHPVDLLRFLLQLIKPNGRIYLTTPNFFRFENRRKFASGENPQEVYPHAGGNWDAHHHHREYGFREMVRFVKEAGGKVLGFYHSGCWDENPTSLPSSERGNLVFLLGR